MASQSSTAININEPSAEDMQMMLACNVHVGARNCDSEMERYIWKRRSDGVYIFNLQKTYEKIVLAARMIVAVEEPQDVVVISARPWGQRATLKFANNTGCKAIAGRFTPGTFTNQIQKKFIEPRLMVVTDPRTDNQAILEASYVNVPCISICHSDSPTRFVDCVIPANNKGKHSIGLIYWLLTREVLRLRGTIPRNQPWDVMVDLFFYRDPDEQDKEEETAGEQFGDTTAAFTKGFYDADSAAAPGIDWAGSSEWTGDAPAPGAGSAESWSEQPAAGAQSWDQSVALTAGFMQTPQ